MSPFTPATIPSGGDIPHTFEICADVPGTSIANNASASLPWIRDATTDALLNLTAPTLPIILTAGNYAFTAYVQPEAMTANGFYTATLNIDTTGINFGFTVYSPATTAFGAPTVVVPATAYLAAGMKVSLVVDNQDGVAARAFYNGILIQRIG